MPTAIASSSTKVIRTACDHEPSFASYVLRLLCVQDGHRVLHSSLAPFGPFKRPFFMCF